MTFGISDMIDNDEASRITQGERDVTPQRQAATVDYQAIEEAMSKCETNEALTAMCTDIRVDMEKRGIWNSEKLLVIQMNGRHKKRIADAAVVVDEFEPDHSQQEEADEVEFE